MLDPLPYYLDGLELWYTAPNGNEIWLPAEDLGDGPEPELMMEAILMCNTGVWWEPEA